ncbi:MAG: Ig-like domain-containing protein, partial [Lachnospiraceae bacterium]|nr:Ig-like domain-containing protein [Lachnospiraceae bacterium]
GTYTVSLNADMVLDETGDDCIDALVYRDVYSADEGKVCITFDLGGNILTVKRSQYSALQLYTGTTVKNGLLRVEGEDGVDVYGDVHIDNLSASKLSATTAYRGEYFDADTVVLSDWFSNGGQMVSQINNLICAGGVFCYNNSKLLVDSLNAQDRSTLLGDAVIIVNSDAVFDSVYVNHEEDAYIARYKDASLAINGDMVNSGKEVLNIGIVNEKATADNMTEAFPEIAEITPQTLLFKTAKKSVPAFVKIWQPAGASAENKALVTAIKDGGVYAVVKGTQPKPDETTADKITKLLLDESKVTIGTGKTATIHVTALTGDGDAVNRPQVTWSDSNTGIISIVSIDAANGNVTVKGVKAGKAKLTAKATDGSNRSVICNITVGSSIERIEITQKKNIKTIEGGKTLKLIAKLTPAKPVVNKLIWTSLNPEVAVVSSNGTVTGISEGTAKITAVPADSRYDATTQTASYEVTVTTSTKAKEVKNLKLTIGKKEYGNGAEIPAMAAGKSISLKAVTYDDAKKKNMSLGGNDVAFYSSDEQIVSVTPKGKVTAKAEGSATVTAVSMKNPAVRLTVKVNVYQAVKKITLNTSTRKVKKGGTGILTVAQFSPVNATDQRVSWTATGVDGNMKAGNVQAIEAAVLPAGKKISDLKDSDYKDIRTKALDTGKGERLVYRTLKATKKCVVTAVSVDGNKKATTTVISNGEVTGLTLKTTKTITGANGNYSVNIKAGKSITIKPVITAEYGADKTLIWSSDNDMITVNNGKITVGKTAPSGTKAVVSANDLNANCKLTINVTVQ